MGASVRIKAGIVMASAGTCTGEFKVCVSHDRGLALASRAHLRRNELLEITLV